MPDDRWLVVGLGNPGPEYALTRHNAGFLVLDLLAARDGGRYKVHGKGHGGRAEVLEGRVGGVRAVLAKPRGYMNESGGPVAAVRQYFDVPLERLVVVHDDLDLPFGSLRLKRGGGDGGHNGLRSVTRSLGSPDYCRVRIGIGRPPGRMDPADYVLRPFPAAERTELDLVLEQAADAVDALVRDGLQTAQSHHAM